MSENRLHPFSKKHVPFLKKGCILFRKACFIQYPHLIKHKNPLLIVMPVKNINFDKKKNIYERRILTETNRHKYT